MLGTFKKQTALLLTILLLTVAGAAQKQKKNTDEDKSTPNGTPVMWHQVNVADQDVYNGAGGEAMKPDLSNITFVSDDKGNGKKRSANKKYKIKDGSGREFTAKLDTRHEARSEAAATRLLYGLGYYVEPNYLVPSLTIPGKGTFENVRLKAHPKGIKTVGSWSWRSNPFVGTNEFQGLKMMMLFMTNWDLFDAANDKLYDKNTGELRYVVGDVDATFGRLGSNNLPLFYRLGRKSGSPKDWNKAKFIVGVKDGKIRFATTGAKNRWMFRDITVEQGRWLYNQLAQLREDQIRDVFRAANYSPAEVDLLVAGTKRRIDELDRATSDRLAKNKK